MYTFKHLLHSLNTLRKTQTVPVLMKTIAPVHLQWKTYISRPIKCRFWKEISSMLTLSAILLRTEVMLKNWYSITDTLIRLPILIRYSRMSGSVISYRFSRWFKIGQLIKQECS